MTTIEVGYVFRANRRIGKIRPGLHRVVEANGTRTSDDCVLIIIPIPEQPPSRQSRSKQPSYYAKGFQETTRLTLHELIIQGAITAESAPPIPPWWAKSDEQLLHECDKQRWIKQGETWVTPEILKRETKWCWIERLVQLVDSREVSSVIHLDALVPSTAKTFKVGSNQIYDALHRYYAFGENKDALLPNTPKSGGKGQERYAKNGVRLGAPNAATRQGNPALAGKICDEQDRENIRDGFQMFVRPGVSRAEAYLAFSSTFYSDGHKIENGYRLPLLLPAAQRPTQREFLFHGPEKQDRESMLRRMFGKGEWAKNYRPLTGASQDGSISIGQVGSIDASPIDVNLVSSFDPYCPIGVPRGIYVREAALGLWCGAHNVIGSPSTADALLTILQAALGQEKKLRRLGLDDISPDDFPAFLFTRLLSDNGELRSIAGIESCASKIRTSIEFVESGRADRNSPSEGGHHSRHAGLDHKLQGTTFGRQPKRGEALPITKALLSLFGYERLLWQWMHWSNTKQRVPHLVPTEMKRDMASTHRSYLPTRIEIFRWADSKGYVNRRPVDPIHLNSNLLPIYTATVSRNGLILHRPKCGDRVELLKDAVFNSEYVEKICLYMSFGQHRPPHVQVRVDPSDLSEIIYVDENGIHTIPNTSRDQIVIREYSIQDLISSNDADRLRRIETKTDIDQAASDLRLSRAAEIDSAIATRARSDQVSNAAKTKPSRESVRENQSKERQAQFDLSIKRAAATPKIQNTSEVEAELSQRMSLPSNIVSINPKDRLAQAMAERIQSFHKRKGNHA